MTSLATPTYWDRVYSQWNLNVWLSLSRSRLKELFRLYADILGKTFYAVFTKFCINFHQTLKIKCLPKLFRLFTLPTNIRNLRKLLVFRLFGRDLCADCSGEVEQRTPNLWSLVDLVHWTVFNDELTGWVDSNDINSMNWSSLPIGREW